MKKKTNVPLSLSQKRSIPKAIGTLRHIPVDRNVDFDIDEIDEEGGDSTILDLTDKFHQPAGIVRLYKQPAEYALAMYAVTQLVNTFGCLVRNSRDIKGDPGVTSITTDVHNMTTVYNDLCATLVFPREGKPPVDGIIQTIMLDDGFRVSMAASQKEGIALMEKVYNKTLEQYNFYQGKTLRFGRNSVDFIPIPSTKMEDAILPPETEAEIDLNVIQFLTNPQMHKITKKRGMLFYGAPGTGKTTSIKAMFRELAKRKITCIYVSDASFDQQSVEDVFAFINKYLAPALVVFEDIDLIAPDRRDGTSRLIGPLLSALNGIEEQKKPIAIVATTNRLEVLDAAVTRPCRFDRRIKIDYPSVVEMHKIFRNVAGFDAPDGCFKNSANVKLTGAHVEEIYRTASLLSEQDSKPVSECVMKAVATVKKHFMIVSPKVRGFGTSEERDDDISPQDEVRGYPPLQASPLYHGDDPFKKPPDH